MTFLHPRDNYPSETFCVKDCFHYLSPVLISPSQTSFMLTSAAPSRSTSAFWTSTHGLWYLQPFWVSSSPFSFLEHRPLMYLKRTIQPLARVPWMLMVTICPWALTWCRLCSAWSGQPCSWSYGRDEALHYHTIGGHWHWPSSSRNHGLVFRASWESILWQAEENHSSPSGKGRSGWAWSPCPWWDFSLDWLSSAWWDFIIVKAPWPHFTKLLGP